MSWYESFLIVGTVVPLAAFILLVFLGHRMGKPLSGWFAVLAMGVTCVLAGSVLAGWHGLDLDERADLQADAFRFHWADLGDIPITVGVKLDSLTVIMFFMVAFVSFWIFVFSVGYMAGHSDEIDGRSKYHRFFTFLCLFGFSMLGLVISSSLLFLFIFWELVGLCSYFLIGFYFDKKFASDAGIKAFVVNRVGDFGFLFGLMMVVFFLGTFDLDQAATNFARQFRTQSGLFAVGDEALTINLLGWHLSGPLLATMMGIGLFCGAIGKSAQFPLHVWLPDAMAGPTPVSALIHAATMVAAGVYLVARVFRLLTPEAQFAIAVIGCITLTITAVIAIVQTDIKKVLAYSTLSQLGYMIFGMGVGAWIAALFHLMTHAFFKAMLFLGSGQVIEGCHHEQEITKMGGLRRKMPITCWTFLVGVLAIAGAGLPWTGLGLGGFFSKDEILAVARQRAYHWPAEDAAYEGHAATSGHEGDATFHLASFAPSEEHAESAHSAGQAHAAPHVDQGGLAALTTHIDALPKWMFWLPIIIAYVTPFYMMRLWWLTFMGKPRDDHVHEHAHESPLMYIPLVVLAVGTVFCSYWVFRPMLADAAPAATDACRIVAVDGHAHDADHAAGLVLDHAVHGELVPIVGFAFVVGFVLAWLIYRNGLELPRRIAQTAGVSVVYRALVQKLYFDHVYNFVFVGGCKALAGLCRLFDTYVIDLIYNLSARVTERFSAFSGWVLDLQGVDGVINGIADSAVKFGNLVRQPQTGRIRNYVLIATGTAAVILFAVVFFLAGGWQAVVGWIQP